MSKTVNFDDCVLQKWEACEIETLDMVKTSVGNSRHTRVMDKIKNLDMKRDDCLRKKHLAGRVSQRKVQDPVSFNRRAPFKWQRSGVIGAGTFSKVYSAIRWDTLERIAVKEIQVKDGIDRKKTLELLRMTVEEYEMIIALNHPSLVKYYGFEGNDTVLLLFMEFCDEGTLAKLCRDMIPDSLIRRYARNLLNGIVYLHDKGIIHRDIKTANIFLCTSAKEEEMIKLGDFGCAIRIKEPNTGTITGEFRELMGSPNYMAPEVCVADSKPGEKGYGRACDIWSLGCVVLEMVTGKMPWQDLDNSSAIIFKVGSGDIPFVPPVGDRMSPDAREFILKCLTSKPENRPTATQLIDYPFVTV